MYKIIYCGTYIVNGIPDFKPEINSVKRRYGRAIGDFVFYGRAEPFSKQPMDDIGGGGGGPPEENLKLSFADNF